MTSEPDPDDEGPFDRLERLVEALAELGDRDGTLNVDADVSVGSLDDLAGDRRRPGSKRTRHPRFGRDRDGGRPGPTVDADDLEPTDGYHVDVVEGDARVEVRADLPGTDPGDVSVDVDGGEVLVCVAGDVVERVPTGWAAATVEAATFNNGVLVVSLERDGGSNR